MPAIWCGRLAGAQAVQYFPQVPMWVELETTPCMLLLSCHLSPQTYLYARPRGARQVAAKLVQSVLLSLVPEADYARIAFVIYTGPSDRTMTVNDC